MSTIKPRHTLSNVDLERLTAVCAVCEDTKIYVGYDLRTDKFTFGCVYRAKANGRAYQQRLRDQKRLEDPNWKPRHKITEVDLETLTGFCSACGLVRVRVRKRVSSGNPYTVFRCTKKETDDRRESERMRYIPPKDRQLSLTLTQQEHNQMIDKHKLEQGCKSCGYKADPREMELHFGDVDEQDFVESKLTQFSSKRLRHALKISEVYCLRCHPTKHSETNPTTVLQELSSRQYVS